MINQKTISVKAIWDNEAFVWVATNDDVPGLVRESERIEDLINKLKTMIPELLEANGLINKAEQTEIPFHLLSERSETAICKG